jgi:hypothetical protein
LHREIAGERQMLIRFIQKENQPINRRIPVDVSENINRNKLHKGSEKGFL